jgi:hypothetical protein
MPPVSAAENGKDAKKKASTILFDVHKKEYFGPTSGYKKLHRKLKANYKIQVYVPNC